MKRIFNSIQDFVVTKSINDEGRDQLWNQAIDYFLQNPLTGIGWNNYKKIFTLRETHVHNIYLQLLCETGIIGFLSFIVFFVRSLIISFKNLKVSRNNSIEFSWILFSLYVQIYFLLYGLSGNPLYDVEEMILYFFAVGVGNQPSVDRKIDNILTERINK